MAKTRTSGQGRPKGIPNKQTKALKEMIMGALHAADPEGGEAYLTKRAVDEPKAFLALLGRILPAEVRAELTGKDGEKLSVTVYIPSNGREQ